MIFAWYPTYVMHDTKRHVITISGKVGSGKTTIRTKLAEKLGYESYSAGDSFKIIAKEKGITTQKLLRMAEMYEYVDELIDKNLKEFLDNHENIVVDGRMAFYLAPDSFKVFLELPAHTAAVRMIEDAKTNDLRSSEKAETVEEMVEKIKARTKSEQKQFQEYYGIKDHMDHKHFDLVVDTRENHPEEVVDIIIDAYQAWLHDNGSKEDRVVTL